MPRGLNWVYDEAKLQGRLWTPSLLGADYRAGFSAKDFDALAITGGSSVDSWQDLLRSGRGVTSVATKPVLTQNAYRGHPCVTFFNSPMDSAATIQAGSTYSVLAVLQDAVPGANLAEPFSIGVPPSLPTKMEWTIDFNGSVVTNAQAFWNGSVRASMLANYTTSPNLIATGLDGGVSWVRAGGTTGATSGSAISTTDAVFRLGGSRPQNIYPFNGRLFCLMVIASPVDSPNYLKTEAWMAWEFSSPELLGSSHPFANRPPLIGD